MKAKKNVNPDELIRDYIENDMGLYALCEKYNIGKARIKKILSDHGVPIKRRGKQPLKKDELVVEDYHIDKYKPIDGYHYVAVDRENGTVYNDYMNNGGYLTTHIRNHYGVETPTLYDRRRYYMRTGNYWWEQWFDIVCLPDKGSKKCPYCGWETTDVNNNSGAFVTHLMKAHNKSRLQYLEDFPEDKEFFELKNQTLNRQLETDERKFVVCAVCGKKLTRITNAHLKKHGMTKFDYMRKYGSKVLSDEYFRFLSEQMKELNANLMPVHRSVPEEEIACYIEQHGLTCLRNDRKTLHGKELDILIPSRKIAIEYNGNMWHGERNGKTRFSHLEKTEQCEDAGVGLIQIFEDEYVENKSLVLSKLSRILGICDDGERIPARKCKIMEITSAESEPFLINNHIQGFAPSSLYMGAYYNERLVGVMSFVQERKGRWNLNRYATLSGTICQGLGGKLFSRFIKEKNPAYVKSFADRRWTINRDSNLYIKIGFTFDSATPPDYRYYNPKVDKYKRFHKFAFRKGKLMKKYGFPEEMSENEMTKLLGYDRIWDCGLYKYTWSPPSKD